MAQYIVTEEPNKAAPGEAWSGFKAGVIGLFVQLSRIISQPRSDAEIYGALFISPQPMDLDGLIPRLPEQHD